MKSFLSELARVEYEVYEANPHRYSQHVKDSLKALVEFVESGKLSKSRHVKFILKMFRYSPKEMQRRWNSNEGLGTNKSLEAFRSQVSAISNQLYQIFGTDVFEAFSGNKVCLNALDDVLDALEFPDVLHDYLWIGIEEEIKDVVCSKSYTIKELQSTLNAVKPYMRKNVIATMDSIDKDKLAYIIKVLRQPLTSNRTRRACVEKVELLKALNVNYTQTTYPVEGFLRLLKMRTSPNGYVSKIDNQKLLRDLLIAYSLKGLDKLIHENKISHLDIIAAINWVESNLKRR